MEFPWVSLPRKITTTDAMKPIAKVLIPGDRLAEGTLNTIVEDLYNRSISDPNLLKALQTGKLDRPHIDNLQTGTEFIYAYIYAHCTAVSLATMYCWAYRKYGTTTYTEWWSSANETKLIFLYFASNYEIKVKAFGYLNLVSDWSATTLKQTAAAPVPSQVTGVTITNQSMYVDPVTGGTMARTLVAWTNNAASEYVDEYEIVYVEA